MGGGQWGRQVIVAGAVIAGLVAAPVDAAEAHARIVGSAPADGTVVDHPPSHVAIQLDAQPATVEGDPVQVFSPIGQRVDTGVPMLMADGRELRVELQSSAAQPAGEYRVVYRIVSSDAHLIVGRLSFTSVGPAAAASAFAAAPVAGPHRLRPAAPPNLWPRLALVVVAGQLVAVLAVRRRRGAGAT